MVAVRPTTQTTQGVHVRGCFVRTVLVTLVVVHVPQVVGPVAGETLGAVYLAGGAGV